MILIFLICAAFWSFGFILFFCEFGQRVSNAFDDAHDTITQFEWYAFPVERQQLLPVMMIVASQSVCIKGFGNLSCVRGMFQKVSVLLHTGEDRNGRKFVQLLIHFFVLFM